MGEKIGYARVSTREQNLSSQEDALSKAGCIRIFTDKISGKEFNREGLKACMDYLRAEDTLVIYRLDRLGRSVKDDHKPDYTNEDLLALYTFTGGVPKYIDLFMQKGCTDMESMVDYIVQSDSPFLNEGKALLIQEFGKKYGNYFAILADIANGRNTTAEIEQNMGDMVIAGHLKKLEEDYELIVRKRPILAKEGSQTVRFEISDLFLRFWFRYFIKYHRLVEMENFEQLGQLIKNDYPTYSGSTLEQYLRQQMMESCNFMDIGSWWQAKKGKEACEIDIVGLYVEDRKALVAEVKRQRKNFKPDDFAIKVETLRNKVLHKYDIQTECLTLEDM